MERFGDLLLIEPIASGGMADVFYSKQLGMGGFEKTVAIKRILPHFATNENFKNLFKSETNLSAMLQHPNITQVFSNGEFNGYLYIVMEYVHGKNVRQLMLKAEKAAMRIPIEISCFIISEALKGLAYAHNYNDERTGAPLNIVHRDISPQNIMVGYEGAVKLVDFGIAQAASRSDATRSGTLRGKFSYMSPEQTRGDFLDGRSDVFSIGIVFWELLTQVRLFKYEDDLKILEKVRACKIPNPSEKRSDISLGLEKICMRALEANPDKRYSSAAEFYTGLSRFMNENHQHFISTDFALFMKNLFMEEIVDEKQRREQLNYEVQATKHSWMNKRKMPSGVNFSSADSLDPEEKTPAWLLKDQTDASYSRSEAQPNAMRTSLNQDPSITGSQNYLTESSLGSKGMVKKINIVAPASTVRSNITTELKARKFSSAVNTIRIGVVAALVALSIFGLSVYLPKTSWPFSNPTKTAQFVQAKLSNADLYIWKPDDYKTFGMVSVTSVPDADNILLNGKTLVDAKLSPIRTPLKSFKLPPGDYEMTLKNSVLGVFKTISFRVEATKNQNLESILNKR